MAYLAFPFDHPTLFASGGLAEDQRWFHAFHLGRIEDFKAKRPGPMD